MTGGETIEQVGARADRVIDRVLGLDGATALVAHSHLLRILAARWLELPAAGGRRFTLDNTTISVLGWERENRVILGGTIRAVGPGPPLDGPIGRSAATRRSRAVRRSHTGRRR